MGSYHTRSCSQVPIYLIKTMLTSLFGCQKSWMNDCVWEEEEEEQEEEALSMCFSSHSFGRERKRPIVAH